MKVIVPYTDLINPWLPKVLRSYGLIPSYRKLNGDLGYRNLLGELWEEKQTFLLVEHDVLPWPGALEELNGCPCEWGTYSYRYHGGIGIAHMLGCAKVTHQMIRKLPDLWKEEVPWHQCDQHLFFAAQAIHEQPHLHRPAVIHLSEKELAYEQ